MPHYSATFNNSGEIIKLSTNAPHADAAYSILTRVLAKRLGTSPAVVRRKFHEGGRDNYEIKEEGDR